MPLQLTLGELAMGRGRVAGGVAAGSVAAVVDGLSAGSAERVMRAFARAAGTVRTVCTWRGAISSSGAKRRLLLRARSERGQRGGEKPDDE
jgi:hypothetical protein